MTSSEPRDDLSQSGWFWHCITATILRAFFGLFLFVVFGAASKEQLPRVSADLSLASNGAVELAGNPQLSLKQVEGGWLVLFKDANNLGVRKDLDMEVHLVLKISKEIQLEAYGNNFTNFELRRRVPVGLEGPLVISNLGSVNSDESTPEIRKQVKGHRDLAVKMKDEEPVAAAWYLDASELARMMAFVSMRTRMDASLATTPSEAEVWCRFSASLGNAEGAYQLGVLLSKGSTEGKVESVKWFLMAAEQGSNDAIGSLGFAYLLGRGVPSDDIEAYAYFNLAAARDDGYRKELFMIEKDFPQSAKLAAQQRSRQIQKELEASREAHLKQLFEARKTADKKGA